ncbi:Cytochrome P450, partial [Dillenia turbinata]
VHDANFSSRPAACGVIHVAYNYQDMAFAPCGPRWRLLRKICNIHLFSTKALNEISILACEPARAGKSPVKLGQMLNMCNTNALALVLIGRREFGDGSRGVDPKADEFKQMVEELMVLSGALNIGDFIPALDWLDLQGIVSKMKKLHKKFDAFLNEIMDEPKLNGGDRGKHTDFLSKLLALVRIMLMAKVASIVMSKSRPCFLYVNLFTVGTDTTSSAVEFAMAGFIRHPTPSAEIKSNKNLIHLLGRTVLPLSTTWP